MQLITRPGEGFREPIDFRKALGMKPGNEIRRDYSYGDGLVYVELEDGRYDFGFQVRWYADLEIYGHKCPECGKRMHKYRFKEEIKCPKCKVNDPKFCDAFIWYKKTPIEMEIEKQTGEMHKKKGLMLI